MANLTLENNLLKKHERRWGGPHEMPRIREG